MEARLREVAQRYGMALEPGRLMVGDAKGLVARAPKVSGGAPFLHLEGFDWDSPDPFGVSLKAIGLEVRTRLFAPVSLGQPWKGGH